MAIIDGRLGVERSSDNNVIRNAIDNDGQVFLPLILLKPETSCGGAGIDTEDDELG